MSTLIPESLIAEAQAALACPMALNWLRATPRTWAELALIPHWYLWAARHELTVEDPDRVWHRNVCNAVVAGAWVVRHDERGGR